MNPNQSQVPAPLYMTDFSGQSENPSIGAGVAVGIDLFTTKTVARLSRKMNKQSGSVVLDLPIGCTISNQGYIYVQDQTGNVYQSLDQGVTWTQLFTSVAGGKGIQVWEDYLFMFNNDDISIYGPLSSGPTLTSSWWTTTAAQNPLQNALNINHFPFVYGQVMYFCNGPYIGYIEFIGAPGTPFDPSVAPGVTYLASPTKFSLSDYYISQTIGLLPPGTFAIGVSNSVNPSHTDVVVWDGVSSSNYVNLVTFAGASNPVVQMITKNGVLYCVTDKEHGVYVFNGSSATLIDRLALRMSNRTLGGTQYTTRLASTIYPSGIDFLGPELLTAGANFPSPTTQIANTGLYPYGVWSVNIESNAYGQTVDVGSTGVIGLRFPLSFGDINAQYTTNYAIGFIKCLNNNSVLVGWQKGATYGIDLLDSQYYISDPNTTFLESSLYLAGTRLIPRTFSSLEFNLVTPLNSGDQIQFFWRTTTGMDYQPFLDGQGNNIGTFNLANMTDSRGNVFLSDAIQSLSFQSADYIQIGAKINAGSNSNLTPQLRDVILK